MRTCAKIFFSVGNVCVYVFLTLSLKLKLLSCVIKALTSVLFHFTSVMINCVFVPGQIQSLLDCFDTFCSEDILQVTAGVSVSMCV